MGTDMNHQSAIYVHAIIQNIPNKHMHIHVHGGSEVSPHVG